MLKCKNLKLVVNFFVLILYYMYFIIFNFLMICINVCMIKGYVFRVVINLCM